MIRLTGLLIFMLTEPEQTAIARSGRVMTPPQAIEFQFDASEQAVRRALSRVRQFWQQAGVSDCDAGQAEIVLAEALNNVVEHAYCNTGAGRIELRCRVGSDQIDMTILDQGGPVPAHVFAQRTGPDTDVPLNDLPEGGFGWMLIQKMTCYLHYQRVGGTNCLCFAVLRGGNG